MAKVKNISINSKLQRYWNEWKTTILVGTAIFVLALFLRLYNITVLPIFGDEAIYIRWAQVMGAEPGLRFVPLSDGKQPLFMWVLMFLVRRFSDPLFIGRLTSAFYGISTLLGVFVLTYYLFRNKRAALLAASIYAITPFALFFDRMALVDSMLSMFGIWTLFFGTVTAKTLRLDFAILTGFVLGGALLTKSPAIFFAILLPITWIVSSWQKKNKLVYLIKLIALLFTSLTVGYGMYNILRLGESFQMLAMRNQDYVFPFVHVLSSPLDPLIGYFGRVFTWFWQLGPSVFILLVFLGIYLNLRKSKKEVLLLSVWAFLPVIVSGEFAKVFTARYIVFVVPVFSILAGISFIGKRYRYIVALLLIFFVIHALIIDKFILSEVEKVPLPRTERSGYLEEWTAGTGIKEVSEIIREEAKNLPAGRQVVVGTEGYFGPLPDGLQAYLNDLPEITVIGVGIDLQKLPLPLAESNLAGNKTYLVVNGSRLLAKPQDLGLDLVAVYPKAFRPDGSRDSLYLYDVRENLLD